ncbi:MAG: hypothetical protein B0W54_23030 [Cellvibrio sp. 79]|nr:MAG: hypothetical protein B0W54_23030 [Cellvibrio sp. 79]
MSNYFIRYCTLISSTEQLEYCQQAQSLGELLARIKKLWDCNQFDDNELLSEINRCNQIPIGGNAILAGNWLPYRYQPKRRVVNWLIPVGHATEPFQDEYISRCCQQLFNQIFQPRSSLEIAIQQGAASVEVQPAGFIFHLSRCGSTLISGCLSELETTCVFSESPLLTELLLDNKLSAHEHQTCLRAFINLQAAAFAARPQMIIKWNAWDIFRWELIRELYPQVPAIFLVRNPLEILASHQRSVGRHMSGDPTLAGFNPVFTAQSIDQSILDKRVQILRCLLQAMGEKLLDQNIRLVDYQRLRAQEVVAVFAWFGCVVAEQGFLKIQKRMQFHSKTPGQVFIADSVNKQQCFTAEERQQIETQLMPAYNQVIHLALKPCEVIIDVQ